MSAKDWVISQILSKSLISSGPLSASESFLSEDSPHEELGNQGNLMTVPIAADASFSTRYAHDNQAIGPRPSCVNTDDLDQLNAPHRIPENASQNNGKFYEKEMDPLGKVEGLQVKFLRLLHRFGMSNHNDIVSKVLHRLHMAFLIRAEKSDLKRPYLRIDRAQKIALEHELSGLPELDFSIKILVLGRSGVGKSSTINSIFNQKKTMTDPFQPATDRVEMIVGNVNGVQVCFVDTPGLLPSSTRNVKKNRKILYAVKRFIRKSPPDIVLYFERLDWINKGYSDFPLLKLIGEILGPAVWFNTILVMTHGSSTLPEATNGYPVNYESFVSYCSELLQHYIHLAISDTKLENPVILVENHPCCQTNNLGDKVLPNGQVWRSEFLLLCLCTKVLADVNSILGFKDTMQLGQLRSPRMPSLPHLLSSFLKHHSRLNINETETELDDILVPDADEEDEYEKLPPIRILTKAQFEKLNGFQRKQYLDELDYRETLYLKKKLREEVHRKREMLSKITSQASEDETRNHETETEPEPDLLPDMALPPSFDPSSPVHRYRFLVSGDQWLTRPVLDPHGWDHDVGFDGVNLETTAEIKKNVFGSLAGQMSKDKQDFSLQSECRASIVTPAGINYNLGLDVQSTGRELVSTLHSNLKFSNVKYRNLLSNLTECGVSLTSFGERWCLGAKLEDSMLIGKRMKLAVNAGRMEGSGKVASGGSLEATMRGVDYPVRDDKTSLAMTFLSFEKETVLGGNLQSDFRLTRGTKLTINASLNSQSMGQISIKTSSSDHLEMALIAVVSIVQGLLKRKVNDVPSTSTEIG